MKLRGWKKLWLLAAIILLFFPCMFILIELPTEARIYQDWSRKMLWKTQAEVPEYQILGIWYLRRQFGEMSEKKLIQTLETEFKKIDYSSIQIKYNQQLKDLRTDQGLIIVEAVLVYLFVVSALYVGTEVVKRIFGKANRKGSPTEN